MKYANKITFLMCTCCFLILSLTGCFKTVKNSEKDNKQISEYFDNVDFGSIDFKITKNEQTDEDTICCFEAYSYIDDSQYKSLIIQLDDRENHSFLRFKAELKTLNAPVDITSSAFEYRNTIKNVHKTIIMDNEKHVVILQYYDYADTKDDEIETTEIITTEAKNLKPTNKLPEQIVDTVNDEIILDSNVAYDNFYVCGNKLFVQYKREIGEKLRIDCYEYNFDSKDFTPSYDYVKLGNDSNPRIVYCKYNGRAYGFATDSNDIVKFGNEAYAILIKDDKELQMLDLVTGEYTNLLSKYAGVSQLELSNYKFSEDLSKIVFEVNDDTYYYLNLKTGEYKELDALTGMKTNKVKLAFADNNTLVFINNSVLYSYDCLTNTTKELKQYDESIYYMEACNNYIFINSEKNSKIYCFNRQNMSTKWEINGQVNSMYADDNYIHITTDDNKVRYFLDKETGEYSISNTGLYQLGSAELVINVEYRSSSTVINYS